MPTKHDHLAADIQDAIDRGCARREILAQFPIHHSVLYRLHGRGLINLANANFKVGAPSGSNRGEYHQVPGWVPDDLRSDYYDLTAQWGEEKAASLVRAMKAEALRAEV